MTFQQLHYLLEVEKTGSISKAAEKLNVTRSGVSLCIRALEEELGYAVFLRTSTGLIPSALGEQVLEHARLICATQSKMLGLRKGGIRHVRIASVDHPPVTAAIARLLKECRDMTDVTFTVRDNYAEPLKLLSAGEVDVVLTCGYPVNGKKIPEGLSVQELARIPVVLLLGPGHRLYRKKPLLREDFQTEILLETPFRVLSRISSLRRLIPFDSERAIAIRQPQLREQLLTDGLCYSLRRMPDQAYLDRFQLRCVRLAGVEQVLQCYTNTAKKMKPEANLFLHLLEEALTSYREPQITEVICAEE